MSNLTKKAIKATFIELLNSRPLGQITVKMIVEECGINRNTFYYHYADLPALIEEIVTEEADRIISAYPAIDSMNTMLEATFEFAAQNKKAILHIYNSVNRDIFERYLWQVCDYVVSAYSVSIMSELPIQPSDRELIERIYRCECFGIVIEWLSNGMPADILTDIDRFCELHKGLPEEMIRRCMQQEAGHQTNQ